MYRKTPKVTAKMEAMRIIPQHARGCVMSDNAVMQLLLKRDVHGCYGVLFKKGSIINYKPWPHEWQGKSEQSRVMDGIFIHCHGQGEFDVFRHDDVELIEA